MPTRENEIPTPSLAARIVRAVTSAYFELVDAETANVQAARARLNFFGKFVPTASGVTVEQVEIAGLDAEWLRPDAGAGDAAILYLHGGAYVMGSCDSHRHLVSHIARAANIAAIVPEYRLAPENPYPAAVEDAVDTYRALLETHSPERILIAGDSAGGGLAVATLLALRDEGDPVPRAAFLLSPWLDLTASGETMHTRSDDDPWFRADDIAHVAKYYAREDQLRDPRVSPVYADVHGMPPVHIQVGDDEILLSDATRFAQRLEAAGIEATVDVWHAMWHVFQVFLLVMPEARRAVDELGREMQRALGEAQSPDPR